MKHDGRFQFRWRECGAEEPVPLLHGLMANTQKVKFLSTVKKDEAAFYLSELAKGLLKNRVSIRVGDRSLVMATSDSIHLEMKALDKDERYAVDIRISWRKPTPGITISADGQAHLGEKKEQP